MKLFQRTYFHALKSSTIHKSFKTLYRKFNFHLHCYGRFNFIFHYVDSLNGILTHFHHLLTKKNHHKHSQIFHIHTHTHTEKFMEINKFYVHTVVAFYVHMYTTMKREAEQATTNRSQSCIETCLNPFFSVMEPFALILLLLLHKSRKE